MQKKRDQALRIDILYLVGATLFTNKNENYVDRTYMKYFQDLDLVFNHAWGAVDLAHMHKELNSRAHYNTKHIS